MSAIIKQRLEDALQISHKLDKNTKMLNVKPSNRPLFITDETNYNVGDENGIYAIALNHNGTQAAVGLGSGNFTLYNCEKSWEKVRRVRTDNTVSLPLLAMKFYPCHSHNAIYTGGSDGTIKVWNLDTFSHSEKTVEEKNNQITSLDFSNDGSYFATGGKDSSLRVYNTDNLTVSRFYSGTDDLERDGSGHDLTASSGHSKKVFAIKFHPEDRNVFLSTSWDRSVKIWDLRSEYAVRTINGPFVCGDGIDIFQGKIVTASWVAHGALELWDYGSGKIVSSIKWPSDERRGEYLYCARFWDENHVVAGGSGTNDLKLINIATNEVEGEVSGNDHPVQAVEVMEQKNLVVCGTSVNVLKTAIVTEDFIEDVESQEILTYNKD